jgi:hypothetical protein
MYRRLPKIMINWKPEGKIWKGRIVTAMSERDLRMGECNNRRQWSMEVGRRRHTF